MDTKLIVIAIMIGAVAATITGTVISFGNADLSSAQMSGGHMMDQGGMSQGMITSPSSDFPWLQSRGSMFNANGMSFAEGVQITGIAVSDRDMITVSLNHGESEESPAVTVVAMTGPMAMMHGASGMGGMGMMQGGQPGMMMQPMMDSSSYSSLGWQNNTEWQRWHTQMAQWHGQLNSSQWSQLQGWHNKMMAQDAMGSTTIWPSQFPVSQSQIGSSVLSAGWPLDSTVTIKLEGDGSVYDGTGIHVMVFPLTS